MYNPRQISPVSPQRRGAKVVRSRARRQQMKTHSTRNKLGPFLLATALLAWLTAAPGSTAFAQDRRGGGGGGGGSRSNNSSSSSSSRSGGSSSRSSSNGQGRRDKDSDRQSRDRSSDSSLRNSS